jgi:hypothetical protein
MAKHLLSARQIQVAREGDTFDGDGLILRVRDKRASWVLRYTASSGKRRELGLGAADRSSVEAAGASLARARKVADEARAKLERGIDPIEARRSERDAQRMAARAEKIREDGAATTLRGYARSAETAAARPEIAMIVNKHDKARRGECPSEALEAVFLGPCKAVGHGDSGANPIPCGQEQPVAEFNSSFCGNLQINFRNHVHSPHKPPANRRKAHTSEILADALAVGFTHRDSLQFAKDTWSGTDHPPRQLSQTAGRDRGLRVYALTIRAYIRIVNLKKVHRESSSPASTAG